MDREPGLQQVAGHRQTHRSGSEKGEVGHGRPTTPPRAAAIP
jgi:hypothetical protein